MQPKLTEKKSTGRLDIIDLAKGLAILLVVWGHIVAGESPKDNSWYMTSKYAVYLFHMPFFMFLSGIVAGCTYKPVDGIAAWYEYVIGKLKRLLPAYLIISVLIVVGKVVMANFVYVDHVPPGIAEGILDVLVHPNRSSAKSFWFIYVLFLLYFSLHPLVYILRNSVAGLIAVGVALQFINGPEFLLLDVYCKFLLFFVLGFIAGQRFSGFSQLVEKYGMISLMVFAGLLYIVMGTKLPFLSARSLVGLFSIPALLYLVHSVRRKSLASGLRMLGKYSFAIYLFNTIFIGLVKAIGLKIMPWDGNNFLLYVPFLLIAGVFFPIALKKYIFVKIPYLDNITR